MYLSFLWCPSDIESAAAAAEFAKVLETQRQMYAHAWGVPVAVDMHCQADTLIGQLCIDRGVLGWQPWVKEQGLGLAWNGVCENFLGARLDRAAIETIARTLSDSPAQICAWDGRFYVISWDEAQRSVRLTTGATESPTLWYTDGPRGWAAGSRGAPLLELVGREKKISDAACNIYLAYGYDYSDESLLQHVHRVPQRTQILIQAGRRPRLSRYATLVDAVNPAPPSTRREDALAACAARLVERVRRQLQYSANPEILVTGGRDSRCIAAAVKRAGYGGLLSTGGDGACRDVVIGKKVAHCLELSHKQTQDRVSMEQFGNAIDRLRLWSRMSEGVEVLRHVRACNDFVEGRPLDPVPPQYFHGLGGEIGRGYYYHNMPDLAPFGSSDYALGRRILLAAANPAVRLSNEARALLEARWDDFSLDLGTDQATVGQWLDMFFWQNSCLRWGGDMLSAKSPMFWAWTPFLDRKLIGMYWALDLEDKRSNSFLEDLTLLLVRELEGLDYDSPPHKPEQRKTLAMRWSAMLSSRITSNRLKRVLGQHKASRAGHSEAASVRFWETVLLDARRPVWKHCMDERSVRKLIRNAPTSELLWNAATVQLVMEAHCD